MADAGIRWNQPEIVERFLAPAQESVALDVALKFNRGIFLEGVRRTEEVNLHRVVDDQVDRSQRIDLLGIAAKTFHRLAHGGEIDYGRHAGQVLHQYTGRHEGNFFVGPGLRVPLRQRFDIGFVDVVVVFLSQQVFEKNFQGNRQAGDVSKTLLCQMIEPKDIVAFIADLQRLSRAEAIHILLCHLRLLIYIKVNGRQLYFVARPGR